MAPTTSRSSSQSKISDTFRSSVKATKPLKETTPFVKPVTTSTLRDTLPKNPEVKETHTHLNPNDPKLVSAARSIEDERQAPFGNSPTLNAYTSSS
jgi:hypothetical protein